MSILFPINTTTIAANATPNNYSIVFGPAEIQQATGYAQLGPVSLSIDIANNGLYPLFVGLTIRVLNQTITIADRVAIGFVAGSKRAIISHASVPQLGALPDGVDQLTLSIYHYGASTSSYTIVSAVRIDPIITAIASSPIIGHDTAVYQSIIYQSFSTGSGLAVANTVTSLNVETIAQAETRIYVHNFNLMIVPTAFPGDVTLEMVARTPNGGVIGLLGRLKSNTTEWAQTNFHGPFFFLPQFQIEIRANNINVAIDYDCEWTITYGRSY